MKKALVVLLMFTSTVYADEKFSTNANIVTTSVINWISVDNVFETCDAESKKRGNGGFSPLIKGTKMDGCSFWAKSNTPNTNTCTIITGKNTDQDTLGHEARHCFQGRFHQ